MTNPSLAHRLFHTRLGAGVGLAALTGGAIAITRYAHAQQNPPSNNQHSKSQKAQAHNSKTNSKLETRSSQLPNPSIVVLGAGFAGLTTAWKLSEHLKGKAKITLVDRNNYHLFTPMLYQVATLGVDPYTVAFPARQFTGTHGVIFRRGDVTGIDFDAATVHLEDADLHYDYLVIALGSTTNFFGNQSAQEHAFPLKRLEDGIGIRNHILDTLEQASLTEESERRRSLLTFVVVGGGATGVETAAALSTMLSVVLPAAYPRLDPTEAKVILIESEGKLLGHMGDDMARIALQRLRELNVEVWLNTKAKDVQPGKVSTDNNREVSAQTIIWATGVQVPQVVSSLDTEHSKGGSLTVDEYLQVCGKPNVYAAGDCSHSKDPDTGKAVPLLAAAAVQEGEAVARNIALALDSKPQEPFHYKDLGNVVALGSFSGAAEVQGVAVGGFAGWLAWRMVHLTKITSFRGKLSTALDWTLGYFYTPDTTRPLVEPRTRTGGKPAKAGSRG